MKNKIYLLLVMAVLSASSVFSQSTMNDIGALAEKDFTFGWVEYNPQKTDYPEADVELVGTISEDLVLLNTNTYLIKGNVYVESGVTVRIFPGTVIRGDVDTKGTLILTKGAKLIANGTSTDPVIFTSNQSVGGREAGDWGGIIMLGDAPINKIGGISKLEGDYDMGKVLFGGTNENSNSGTLKYVRIEFAGKKISANNHFGALTLAGVGNSTQVDYVQVSNSSQNGFDFIGGTLTPEGLVSHFSIGDDYEFIDGYKGHLKNCIAIRHPLISDHSGASSFNVVGYSGVDDYDSSKPSTDVILLSPSVVKLQSTGINNVASAITISNSATLKLQNGLIVGFDSGVVFADAGVLRKIQDDQVKITDTYVSTTSSSFVVSDNEEVVHEWYDTPKFHNKFLNGKQSDWSLFRNATSKGKIDLRLDPETVKSVVGF